MPELLTCAAALLLGIGVGYTGARTSARWFPGAVLAGAAVCAVIVLYGRSTYACPAGDDCEPVTWANWTWLGIALVGLWLLAVGMGYALSERFRSPT